MQFLFVSCWKCSRKIQTRAFWLAGVFLSMKSVINITDVKVVIDSLCCVTNCCILQAGKNRQTRQLDTETDEQTNMLSRRTGHTS